MKGFTLIELLLVIAITLILAAVAVPIYGNLQVSSQLNENASLLIQNLRTSQEHSIARVHNSRHGVKLFENSYVLYEGSSYGSRAQSYDRTINLGESINLQWSLSGTGQTDEINFSKSFGIPDMTGTIVLTHEASGTRVISINELGIVEEEN